MYHRPRPPHGADGAAADGDGGDAVPDRLAQRRRHDELCVVVGVHVEKTRRDPAAASVDDAGTPGGVERLGADGGHATVADPHVTQGPRTARPIEEDTVLDDDIEGHAHPRSTVRE